MWIFGQVWLFSLVAFALGVLLTWLVWARPLRRRVADLERQLTRSQSAPALAGGSRSTMANAFAGPGTWRSAFTGPNTYEGGRSGGPSSSSPSVTAFNTPPTPVDEPLAERAPAVREASFFDEPDQYDTSWRGSLRNQDTTHSEPVAEPAVAARPMRSSGTVPTPEENQPEEDQDADYFAYLDEIGARDRKQPTEPADDLAEQRGTLRFSSSPGAPDEEQAETSADEGHRVERMVPTSFSGSDVGSFGDLGSESTQQLRPVDPEGAQEPQDEPTGMVSGRLSGELSGRLDVPAPVPEPVAPEPVAEEPAIEESIAWEPAWSDERNRSMFEPALQPQDEATTAEDADEQPSAGQPMGPFGPGSALPKPDGSAPSPEFQVKARTSSMVFHTTSSPFYDRLLPQVWFHTPEDAMRAGFTSWERPEGTWGERH
ncbi:MAG: hypothetical protein ACRDQ5_25645 [Sciscionella sp.]